jgi:hypothetical protein
MEERTKSGPARSAPVNRPTDKAVSLRAGSMTIHTPCVGTTQVPYGSAVGGVAMPSIRINPTIAKNEIGQQVERGKELLQELEEVGSIRSHKDLTRVRQDHVRWSQQVVSLLNTDFEGGEKLAAEWETLRVGPVEDDASLLQNIRNLSESTSRGIEWLTGLQSRLNEFPQSPTTPVPGAC